MFKMTTRLLTALFVLSLPVAREAIAASKAPANSFPQAPIVAPAKRPKPAPALSANELQTASARTFPSAAGTKVTQLPFFQNSSMSSAITPFPDSSGFVTTSETGASAYFNDSGWARIVTNYYEGKGEGGYGSIVADPASDTTMYGCFGNNYGDDEYGWTLLGNLVRFNVASNTDGVLIANRVAGDASYRDSVIFGCNPGTEFGRDIVEPETGLSIWYTIGHSPRFAFDTRETVSGVSQHFYFLTRLYGPVYATLSDDGSVVENVEFLDAAFDPGTSVSSDEVMTYWDSESNKVGAVILLDPVHLENAAARGLKRESALYVGYYDNAAVAGGLRRILTDETGAIIDDTWLDDPETGMPLDARDVDCLENESIELDNGMRLSRYCIVAAGRDGVYVLRNEADGGVTLINASGSASLVNSFVTADSGAILSRRSYINLCAAATGGCSDISSYFTTDIDVQIIDDIPYVVLTETRKIYAAALTDPENIFWTEVPSVGGPTAGSAIIKNEIVSLPGKISLQGALDGSVTSWTETAGYSDRSGFSLSIDPNDASRVVGTDLDGTAMFLKYGADYDVDSLQYSVGSSSGDENIRAADFGICYGLVEKSDTSNITQGDHVSDDGASRYNSYGKRIVWAKKNGVWKGILGADFYDGNDGNLHELIYDSSTGRYSAHPIIGARNCVNAYPDWNNAETVCIHVCEPNPDGRELPNGETGNVMVTRENADNILVVLYNGGSSLWSSTDGGKNWNDVSEKYVYGPTGTSLSVLGKPTDVVAHPSNENVFYLAYGYYGVYKLDLSLGYATHISPVVDDDPSDPRMPSARGKSFTSLGETIFYTPYIYDIEAVVGDDGVTRLHTANYVFNSLSGSWGKWPESPGGVANGGGDYVIVDDGLNQPGTKLNFMGDTSNPLQNFALHHLAVSNDGQTIVLVGANAYNWDCQGYAQDITSGAIFTRDGGTTWQNLFPDGYAPNVWSVAADPNDPDKFVIGMSGDGMWEVKFESDTEHPEFTLPNKKRGA